jgi:hypothetical protein
VTVFIGQSSLDSSVGAAATFFVNTAFVVAGFKSSCSPNESGNFGAGMDNLQSMNSEDQSHLFQTSHYSPEEHEYQALEAGHQPPYLESSPEFYAANNLIESKYHPHSYVKNYARGE